MCTLEKDENAIIYFLFYGGLLMDYVLLQR